MVLDVSLHDILAVVCNTLTTMLLPSLLLLLARCHQGLLPSACCLPEG
jgi:hypothetical protein